MHKKKQIFLLHFAGGNAYSYQFMRKYLEEKFEFIPLELSGRGRRMSDELFSSRKEAVIDYFHQIRERRNSAQYVIYGHSMGASLSVEVSALLSQVNDAPQRLFVTGNAGPRVPRKEKRYLLPKEAFIDKLQELGGIPEEVLNNRELLDFFLPVIRADFEIIEADEPLGNSIKIGIPIVAMMGNLEKDSTKIEKWKDVSSKEVITEIFPGNHFFIHKCAESVARTICKEYD